MGMVWTCSKSLDTAQKWLISKPWKIVGNSGNGCCWMYWSHSCCLGYVFFLFIKCANIDRKIFYVFYYIDPENQSFATFFVIFYLPQGGPYQHAALCKPMGKIMVVCLLGLGYNLVLFCVKWWWLFRFCFFINLLICSSLFQFNHCPDSWMFHLCSQYIISVNGLLFNFGFVNNFIAYFITGCRNSVD